MTEFYSTKQITSTNDILPDDVIEDIETVSIQGDEVPFGSYVTRVNAHPGDVDLFEEVTDSGTRKDIAERVARRIQEIVEDLEYFSELKAGIDPIYQFDIGPLERGVWYKSSNFNKKVKKLYSLNYLTSADMIYLLPYIEAKSNLGQNDYDKVYNFFRDRWLLRWSKEEVKQGYKSLKWGKKYISQAVLDRSPLKIDALIIADNGQFMELTNFIVLQQLEDDGDIVRLNTSETLNPLDLKYEIEKLYFSDYYFNPFKMVKRALSLLRYLYKNHNNLLKSKTEGHAGKAVGRIYDPAEIELGSNREIQRLLHVYSSVLKSTLGILNQIISELEVMSLMLERTPDPPIKKIRERLDYMITPLSKVLEISPSDLEIYSNMLDEIKNLESKDELDSGIKELMYIFKQISNTYTIKYFIQLGVNPPPDVILPSNRSYKNIIRSPDSLVGSGLGSKIAGSQIRLTGSGTPALALFRKVANSYRKRFCDGKSRQLYPGEVHMGCHNYTGPGTRVDITSVRNHKPYNEIDACSRQHDLDYMAALNGRTEYQKTRIRDADDRVLKCYDQHKNVSGYTLAKNGINWKVKAEDLAPRLAKMLFGKISGV